MQSWVMFAHAQSSNENAVSHCPDNCPQCGIVRHHINETVCDNWLPLKVIQTNLVGHI